MREGFFQKFLTFLILDTRDDENWKVLLTLIDNFSRYELCNSYNLAQYMSQVWTVRIRSFRLKFKIRTQALPSLDGVSKKCEFLLIITDLRSFQKDL